MANGSCAGLVAAAATAGFLLVGRANGHCHQQFPMSRSYSRSKDFHDFT